MKFKLLTLSSLFLTACVTTIDSTETTNPPPAEKFSAFSCYEVKPIQGATEEVTGQTAAMQKIQDNIDEKLKPRIDDWNKESCTDQRGRTLVIEPMVTEMKFVGGAKRVFAGAFAGSSAVILKATFTEKETGAVIATPEFYSKSSAMAGAYSFGGNDNAMLGRIANSLAHYTFTNHEEAVGGPVQPVPTDASEVETD